MSFFDAPTLVFIAGDLSCFTTAFLATSPVAAVVAATFFISEPDDADFCPVSIILSTAFLMVVSVGADFSGVGLTLITSLASSDTLLRSFFLILSSFTIGS